MVCLWQLLPRTNATACPQLAKADAASRLPLFVTGPSRGADAARLHGLDTQHDPGRASALARRTRGDDNGLFDALQPLMSYSSLAIRARAKPSKPVTTRPHIPFVGRVVECRQTQLSRDPGNKP